MRALAILCLLAAPAAAQDADRGRALYLDRCADCHGDFARGDGWLAPIMPAAVPNLTTLRQRYGGEFPVVSVIWQIDGREPLMSHGGQMPVFAEILSGQRAEIALEDGTPIETDRTIADIIAYLQEIQE